MYKDTSIEPEHFDQTLLLFPCPEEDSNVRRVMIGVWYAQLFPRAA